MVSLRVTVTVPASITPLPTDQGLGEFRDPRILRET